MRPIFGKAMYLWLVLLVGGLALPVSGAGAAEYRLNPGDALHVSVWNEQAMERDLVILPDGTISYPLAGQMAAAGLTPKQLEAALVNKLERFYPTPTVTVAVTQTSGNLIYVIGEVRAAGQFPVSQQTDVLQALSLARGLTEFADTNSIKVIRRAASGEQQSLGFNYGAIQRGKDLSSNIVLQSGDVVLVPAKGLF